MYWYKVFLFVAIAGLVFGPQIPAIENFLLGTNQQLIQNQQADTDNRAYWMEVANNAWQYYQPGVGVSSSTGLHYAHINYQGFTDWDLGVYVQAVVDAAKLGIITNEGAWGFDDRIDKVLTFLENRPVSSDGTPYTWYSSITGENIGEDPQFAIDAANLLVALKNVELYRPTFANRVDNLVKTRTNYEPLKQVVDTLTHSVNIYDYYAAAAFATFWPEQFEPKANTILNNIINAPTTTYEGVILPKAKLMCEPLLSATFYLPYNSNLMNLARTLYLAHEARYNATGNYVAFTEGNPAGVATHYIWEWVVLPDGHTWVIQRDEFTAVQITPVIFLKAAVGLFALYNTQFTQNMVNDMVPDLRTSTGYLEGKTEIGQIVSFSSDKTNGMIIGAARYAIDNNSSAPNPTQSTTPPPATTAIPTPTSTIIDTSTPNVATGTSPSLDPTPTSNPTITSSPTDGPNPSPTATTTLPSSSPPTAPIMPSDILPTISPSFSPTPTIDSFWLTQPIILIASAIASIALVLLALKYHKKRTRKRPEAQAK